MQKTTIKTEINNSALNDAILHSRIEIMTWSCVNHVSKNIKVAFRLAFSHHYPVQAHGRQMRVKGYISPSNAHTFEKLHMFSTGCGNEVFPFMIFVNAVIIFVNIVI